MKDDLDYRIAHAIREQEATKPKGIFKLGIAAAIAYCAGKYAVKELNEKYSDKHIKDRF